MTEDRSSIIIRTSIIGIIANVFLAGFKAAVGFISGSIAIILDAVNNLSDALSSVITIIGAKLAGKKPDKKHPLGHGRIEYLSAMVVAAIVLYAGFTSLIESVKKIIHPEKADYSIVTLIILAVAIAVKLLLGNYVKKTGEKVNSGSLIASGSDALFDAVISTSVLISAIVFMLSGLSLEAYVGVLISVMIIKAGIEMLADTYDEILGKRLDADYLSEIRRTICESEYVFGAYDLILHSYGPERLVGSVHIEIPDTLTAADIDDLEREIAAKVLKKHGVILGGIGIYCRNTGDDSIKTLRSELTKMVMKHDGTLQMHGFHINKKDNTISFDVIIDYDIENRKEIYEEICREVTAAYPEYKFNIALDIDI